MVKFLVALLVLAIVATPIAGFAIWRPPLEQLRDVVVVVYGLVGVLLFAILIVVATALLFSVQALTRAVRDLINDPLKPTLNDVRSAIQDIRGTTEFLTDTAVSPLIRVVAVGRGIKKGLSIATGFGRRKD